MLTLHPEKGPTRPRQPAESGQGGFPQGRCGQFGNETGRAAVSPPRQCDGGFFMPDVSIDYPDEHHSAFVDPWSDQPQHRGDIPDHAVLAGAWHLDVGIDIIHEALFLARDHHGDRLWSLTTPSETVTRK